MIFDVFLIFCVVLDDPDLDHQLLDELTQELSSGASQTREFFDGFKLEQEVSSPVNGNG